jgi:hypothetical protein
VNVRGHVIGGPYSKTIHTVSLHQGQTIVPMDLAMRMVFVNEKWVVADISLLQSHSLLRPSTASPQSSSLRLLGPAIEASSIICGCVLDLSVNSPTGRFARLSLCTW